MSEAKTKWTRRGFGAMDPDVQREMASRGGQSVRGENRAFARDRSLAAAAGRKGALARAAKRRGETP